MTQNQINKPSHVFEHFDGQKFTVRGTRKRISYGEKSHRSGALHLKTETNRMSMSSISFKPSEMSRASHRHSQVNFKTSFHEKQLDTTLTKHGTKMSKSTYLDEEYWAERDKSFNDEADISEHPSYSIKNVAYNLECEMLYLKAKEKYDSQFFREVQYIIKSNKKTSDQYFTKRILSYTTLWPPLHTKSELDIFKRRFFQLTPAERNRVDYLMATDLSDI
ncbi:uncharacterized protein LOC117791266 [Drosophila innubila]|uniref:uncharacterized protein LOC117791266 n=1 Tax=Drosophila innubila TaxID=198719 RepID=UPI00148BA8A8|nr:uncharacterized protein LOC117791266 [Drosophila innubila]